MAAVLTHYAAFEEWLLKDVIELSVDTLKVALLSSSYTLDLTAHDRLASVSAFEIAAAGGYVTGGLTLAGVAVARSGADTFLGLNDLDLVYSGGTWPAWRCGVIYAAVTRGGIINPLIAHVLADDTAGGTDIPATAAPAATRRLRWNPAGVFQL